MKGFCIEFSSKKDREGFLKSFLASMKKSKTYDKAFSFSDDGDKVQGIEVLDECDGAITCALITIKGTVKIKITGVGMSRIDPVELPEGASVMISAR